MPAHRSLFGLVLAGGQSRRMGSDKALLVRDGQNQLDRAMQLLGAVTERTFVSVRSDQQNEPARSLHAQIVDRHDGIGPIAGILSAMEEYPDVDWLVVACDLPNVDAPTLRYLLEHRAGPFTAFRSSNDGLPEPLCAVYSAESADTIRGFVEAGIVCPRKMLIQSDTCLLNQPHAAALDNVNTPDDLEASALKVAR